ncbi:MAG: hypothetical protein AB7T09_08645 [Planctomycetota bacterium]
MSDEHLRELERRWKLSGAVEDEAALLRANVRAGSLSESDLELAAYLGHEAAGRVIGPVVAPKDTVEAVMEQITKSQFPSSGGNLSGFLIDLEHALECSPVVAGNVQVRVYGQQGAWERRDDLLSNMVEVHAEVAEDVDSLQELASGLKRLWGDVHYGYFEATSLIWAKEATLLRFVTVLDRDELFVTGTLRVSGMHYQPLVDRFEKGFGPLPSLEQPAPQPGQGLDQWVRGLGRFGQEPCDRAGIAAARFVLPVWLEAFPSDQRPLHAVEALEGYVLCRCEGHKQRLSEARTAAGLRGAAARPEASPQQKHAALATVSGDTQARFAARATSELAVRQAIRGELIPWALKRVDLVRERAESRRPGSE